MYCTPHEPQQLWSIILPGEERAQPHTRAGLQKPAPYCTLVGTRSMLQHTWDRADQLSHPHCKITVVEKSHLHETCTQFEGRVPGTIVTEPSHRGTVVSLFLALTYLRAKDPHARVVTYPSTHFIYPEDLFLQTVQRAIWATERYTDHVVLVGVAHPEQVAHREAIALDRLLGWVYGMPIYHVSDIVSDHVPAPHTGETLDHPAMLWNTSVLVASAEMLWELGWQFLPGMMTLFEELHNAIGTSYERSVLEQIFQNPMLWDTSLATLLQLTPHVAAIELEKVLWSDWDEPAPSTEHLVDMGDRRAVPSR